MAYTRQFVGRSYALLTEMRDIVGWLTANDIPADDVPLDARVVLDRRNMSIDVFLRRNGRFYVADDGEGFARGTVTVPIRRRPPVLASLGPARRTRRAS